MSEPTSPSAANPSAANPSAANPSAANPGAAIPDDPEDRTIVTPTDPEDQKIITLARASRARAGATQGACVRDGDGRTYAATNVALDSLSLSAIQLAVAMAVSSSAPGLEAAALVADDDPTDADLALVREVAGRDVLVWVVGPDGAVRDRIGA